MKNMKYVALSLLAVLTLVTVHAQQNLKFKINGLADTTVMLAGYTGKNLLYVDTAKVDSKGIAVFNKKKHPGGMYAFVYNGKIFEFVVNDEDVYMESDKNDLSGAVKVIKSKENKVFYDYVAFINKKLKEATPLREEVKKATESKDKEKEKKAREDLRKIDDEVKAYQKDMIAKNSDLLISKILKLSMEIELPEPPKNPDGTLVDSLWAYKYMRKHYFDNLDGCDDRMLHTKFFFDRMENFFKTMVAPNPDSIMVACDEFLSKIECGKEMFKYCLSHLTYEYETSKIMCMDAVFVYLVNKYYKTGKVTWLKADKLEKVINRAKELEPILCQKQAHNLSLLDTAGQNWRKLYDQKNDYTILIFWDPDCGHCKKELPKFVELYNKMKSHSLGVYAVSSDHNDAWRKFIRDNKMQDFTNVGVPGDIYKEEGQKRAHELVQKGVTDYTSLNYRDHFDIYATPKIFLLDKNFKIIAKQVEAEQMEKILEYHFKMTGK